MTKLAINSNVSSLTGFAPFKLNCGYMPTIIGGITPFENTKPGIKRFINEAIWKTVTLWGQQTTLKGEAHRTEQ